VDELEQAKSDTASVEIEAVRAWEKERTSLEQQLCDATAALEAKNECEVQQMDKRCRRLEEKVREANEWVDMGKELYETVFKLDGFAKDPHCVNKLYRKVTALSEDHSQLVVDFESLETDHARLERLQAASAVAVRTASTSGCPRCAGGGLGGGTTHNVRTTADRIFDKLDRNADGVVTRGEMRGFVAGAGGGVSAVDRLLDAGGAGADISAGKAEYLAGELRRSTQAMASAKRKFDDFKEAVAKALKFGKKVGRPGLLPGVVPHARFAHPVMPRVSSCSDDHDVMAVM
jgi:hydroxypyruvate isomerase